MLGVLVASLANSLRVEKEARVRLAEKVAGRRLEAHERVLQLVKEMREMTRSADPRFQHLDHRIPRVLTSLDTYDAFRGRFTNVAGDADHWLDNSVRRLLYLTQDYFVNLDSVTAAGLVDFDQLAVDLRPDFIDLASQLEGAVVRYLRGGIGSLRFPRRRWHKFRLPETERRLRATRFFQKYHPQITKAHAPPPRLRGAAP